jgi:hypothetical protein
MKVPIEAIIVLKTKLVEAVAWTTAFILSNLILKLRTDQSMFAVVLDPKPLPRNITDTKDIA